jgi:hypothetical protein
MADAFAMAITLRSFGHPADGAQDDNARVGSVEA